MVGAEIKRPPVFRITVAQLIVLASVSALLLMFDVVRAYSVLSGGLIAALPQAYFAARAFRWRGSEVLPRQLPNLAIQVWLASLFLALQGLRLSLPH